MVVGKDSRELDSREGKFTQKLVEDPELDPSRPAPPPTKAIDRPVDRSGKRDAPKEQPARHTEGPRRAG
jgi:plasminogen activator inhibitor 1 RNA-binding protein